MDDKNYAFKIESGTMSGDLLISRGREVEGNLVEGKATNPEEDDDATEEEAEA